MERVIRIAVMAGLTLFAATGLARAQATAELSGRVTDESGAVLPGVTVTATQSDTGASRTVVTDETGTYLMPNLPTGPYRLDVSLQGFRSYAQTGIALQVGGTPTINVVLAVGNLEETVSVEAAAPLVDVRSAGISAVVENERILELPLQGRQVTDLIVLAGAAVQTSTSNTRAMRGGAGIAVAGGGDRTVGYKLDGAMHNDVMSNMNLALPFPDALQEFSVSTSGLSAQNGFHSGASVNAVTKSGTNAFHGNAFEFVRDRRFNSPQYFAPVGPDGKKRDDGLNRNQWGGTGGGPLARDRVFFFGGYQATRLRQVPADLVTNVPTAAMLAGDFTAFASPACNGGRQVTLRAPFANNRINPALFSRASLNLAGRLPQSTHPCGELTYSRADNSDEWQGVGRVDYQATPNHSIFGRYLITSYNKPSAYEESQNPLTTAGGVGLDNLAHSLAFGDTLVFGSNVVNAFRIAYNKTTVIRANASFFGPPELGMKVHNYSPISEMNVSVTGGFTINGGTQSYGDFHTSAYQVSDDLTFVRGGHQITVGANVALSKVSYSANSRSGGDYAFSGQITGLGMADFLLGRVAEMEHGGPVQLPLEMWYLGLFAQDAWRVSNRVTVNVGVRWEPFFGQAILRDNAPLNFSMDNFRTDVRSQVFLNAPAGLLYYGDPGFPGGRSGLNTQWGNVSPRLGLAWDVSGDGRTALRSSYGLSYDFPVGDHHNMTMRTAPFGNGTLMEDPPGGWDDPYAHIGGDPHPIQTNANTPFLPYGPYGAISPDINSPRTQSWNVTVERQLGADWAASASYLGSYSDHLWWETQLNPGVFLGLGPCTLQGVSYAVCTTNANIGPRRRLSLSGENPEAARKIGILDLYTDISAETYRGLKLSAQRRSASGLSVNGSYTWSRCYGDPTSPGFLQEASGFTNPDDPAMDRGYCAQDRTHLASLTLGIQSPVFDNAALRMLASSWRFSGIVNARSGSRLNVITGRDNAFNGQTNQRPNQISDDVYGGTLDEYLRRTAFEQPAAGTFGNFERNSIVGPGFWAIDLAVSRLISLGAAQTLELRLESFNVLNNFNWGNPVVNFGSGTFGRIRSQAGDPRIIQFGIKYGF
jgi:hypothetical protein